ncbi:MAG: DinB family protein [Anaerolineae bacterium]
MLPPALHRISDDVETMRARVLGEVAGLSQRQSDWNPTSKEWSVGEALHHLVLAEGIGGKLITVTLKGAAEQGALPPYPQEAEKFEWTPPTPDDRWMVQAPEPAAPTSGQPIDELRKAMAQQAEWTRKVLERLTGVDPRAYTARHPIIGDMNLAQWCQFAAYHMGVHLRQIQEIKGAAGFPGQ